MVRKLDKWERRFLEWPTGWARFWHVFGIVSFALGAAGAAWAFIEDTDSPGSATLLLAFGLLGVTNSAAARAIAAGQRLLRDAGGMEQVRSFDGRTFDEATGTASHR